MQGARLGHAVAKWTLLLVGAFAAVLCWVALCGWGTGGASTSMSLLRSHRTEAHLCYAGASLATGLAAFLAIRARRFTRALLAAALAAAALVATPYLRELWFADSCLDSGGRWNASAFACEK